MFGVIAVHVTVPASACAGPVTTSHGARRAATAEVKINTPCLQSTDPKPAGMGSVLWGAPWTPLCSPRLQLPTDTGCLMDRAVNRGGKGKI